MAPSPRWLLALTVASGPACTPAGPVTSPGRSPTPAATVASAPLPAPAPVAPREPASTAESPLPAQREPSPPEVSLLHFERELEVDVRSIGIGKQRVAVLSDEPWMKDRGKWRSIPIPERYRPGSDEHEDVRIFFGRDDRPRLMGTRHRSGTDDTVVYLRLQPEGWRPALYEIGQLGNRNVPGGLFGVLGHADPEVVCKVGAQCIIKRLSGWTTVASGPDRPRVKLCGARVWALYPRALAHVTEGGWQRLPAPVPWEQPSGFWAINESDAWVAVAPAGQLYHYDGQHWSEHASVVAGPREMWATGSDDVWLVGDDGAAHFDGTRWSRVRGPTGPLSQIEGAGSRDLWLGGASGLWHGTSADSAPGQSRD